MKKTNLMEAINDIDPKYVEMARPGKKAARVRLVALVAAVLAVAVIVPTIVVFANKAPEEEVPAVMTETPKETTEKTETKKEETTVEQTETPVETATPATETKIPYTDAPTYENNPQLNYTNLYQGSWINFCKEPLAVIRITEITDIEYYGITDSYYIKVGCDPLFSMGYLEAHSIDNPGTHVMRKLGEQLEINNNYIYIEKEAIDEISVGDVLFCMLLRNPEGREDRLIAYRRGGRSIIFPFVDGEIYLGEEIIYSSPIEVLNNYLKRFKEDIDTGVPYKDFEIFNRMPQEIGNGSSIEEVIDYLKWYEELFELSGWKDKIEKN